MMARTRTDRTSALAFDAITVEGALISSAMLARVAQHKADGQTDADYGVPKGLTLRDEIARYFRIGQAMFKELMVTDTPSTAATVNFVEKLLRDVFGFADIGRVSTRTVGDRKLTVTLEGLGGRVPIVVVPPPDDLDRPSTHLTTDGRRCSAASTLQDWLNAGEALWGLCANGVRLRLMRDNASLTRPAYIEADLRRIFESDAFADFAALWLLIHSSRFGVSGTSSADCALERWRDSGQKEGITARDKLRDGVEAALLSLGNGLLSHSNNTALREKLQSHALPLPEFFSQLLRLVYRLIFLLAAEDRNLLHPPDAPATSRKLYTEGYSVGTLRDRAVRRSAWDRHHDRWEGLLVTFIALGRGEQRLGLPALGGLFAPEAIPDLEGARLANRSLMEAIFRLAWLREPSGLVPVNWRDMETEELGSVYESLLELTPRLTDDGHSFDFAEGNEAKGHARKTSGSYYTPDSLVQVLLDSALDPVLDRIEAEAEDPAAALLFVTVLDPACGSGHFLLAAARRIATRLARARAGGVASPADYRHALRDVARRCIHGVDRNLMAAELTKVALWIETVEPGKPLGFLDANIRCGDSLFGIFNLKVLEKGIPDAAYKPLAGDDKETAKHFEKRNKAEYQGQGSLDFTGGGGRLPAALPMADEARVLRAMPEDSPEDIVTKRKRFEATRAEPHLLNLRNASDLYIAAFLMPKTGGVPGNRDAVTIPTTAHVWDALAGRTAYGPLIGRARDLASVARAFHWPLEFPDVMGAGGFDVILGNPPWERIKLQEQEFFAAREPEIAEAPTAAARGSMIARLKEAAPGTRKRTLYGEFEAAKRTAEASSIFAREGGRFPLTGTGDVNTYGLFAELFMSGVSERGRTGIIVPADILSGDALKEFFQDIVDRGVLKSSIAFENEEFIFPGIANVNRFALITLGTPSERQESFRFAFYLRQSDQIYDEDRFFVLFKSDFKLLNPNTRTCPVFRSKADADLTKQIYARVPALINESQGEAFNPWGISFATMFHMTNDSNLFHTENGLSKSKAARHGDRWRAQNGEIFSPLYEGKFVWHYDHRFSSYHNLGKVKGRGGRGLPPVTLKEYDDPNFCVEPRYWVSASDVEERFESLKWKHNWMLGWRDIASAKLERTMVPAVIPMCGVGNTLSILLPSSDPAKICCLLANLSSLVLDYFARQKIAGTHLNQGYLKQFPVLTPSIYDEASLAFIVPRVLELTYTSHSMASFARDLGYEGPPFAWDEDRRALLRCELDAWYARAYGLTRDELRYVLDPADVRGPEYPSETFRVLKNNEIARFGEYRTARLVLTAWDAKERAKLSS
jgi:hypothetical protein